MSDVFISYARSTARHARAAAEALRAQGVSVWLDDDLPAHRVFGQEIEAQLAAAKVALVIWSDEAARSHWVLSEANRAREEQKLVQIRVDDARLPMPFDQIQCEDVGNWTGEPKHPGWMKVVASIKQLSARSPPAQEPTSDPAPPPLPSRPSLAVMPFVNLSSSDDDYFVDGVVEEITTALSRVRSMFVIASGSTLGFRGKAANPADVARQLGVRYVLEGSVRKDRGRVRIAVRLLDASLGAQIWADRFEDTLEDIFSLQDRVAVRVAGKIEPTIRESEIGRSARSTGNIDSYDLFLRALPLWRPGTREGALAALELLHRAIDLEPGYGPSLAVAAWCHGWLAVTGSLQDKADHGGKVAELAPRALQASPDDPEVLTYVADALVAVGGDVQVSLDLIDQAITQNPGYAFAWLMSGAYRIAGGDTATGVDHLQTSMRMDPMTTFRAIQLCWMGTARVQERRFHEAITLLRQASTLLPDYPWTYPALAAACGHVGEAQGGREAISRFQTLQAATVEEWLSYTLRSPDHRELFLQGVALSRGQDGLEA